jgi:hypothetical protein
MTRPNNNKIEDIELIKINNKQTNHRSIGALY